MIRSSARQHGFTLIEVLIGVVILGMITAALGQASWLVTKGKQKVEKRQLMYHKVRVAMLRIERDLSMAYIVKPTVNATGGITAASWKTGLQGENSRIALTSLSGQRLVAGQAAADQREVGYELADLPEPEQREDPQTIYPDSARQLMRREDPELDDRFEEGGTSQVLLEGVLELRLEYNDPKDGEWKSSWDSTGLEHPNLLPRAIRVTLVLPHPLNPESKSTFTSIALLGLGPDPVEIP